MTPAEYWQESLECALDEMGLFFLVEAMSKEQRAELGEALATSHEHYGMAFYSPPASDRLNVIEREYKDKIVRLEAEYERYQRTAEKTVGRILRCHSDASISIDKNGDVYRHGGRTERIA